MINHLTARFTAFEPIKKLLLLLSSAVEPFIGAFLPEINVFPEKSSCRLLLFFTKAILSCVSGSLIIIPRG